MEYKLSELYPNRKPFMDENGKRKVPDLRTQVLTGEAKRHCYHPGATGEGQAFGGLHVPHQSVMQNEPSGQQESRQPTDFSGFFKELKQHQPALKQHEQQSWHQHGQRQDQRMADNSTRFAQQEQAGFSLDQLLSEHSLQAMSPPQQHLQSMIELDRTFAPDASRDGFMRGANAAGSEANGSHAAAVARQEHWHLRNMQLPPWDWSLKSRVRLSSTAPFAFLDQQRTAGLAAVCQAVSTIGQYKDAAGASNQEQLAKALVQYQYPSTPMSGAIMAALRAGPEKEGPACLAARVNCWREALRSAYTAMRHGHCPVVYIVGQAFRQQFTAMLCAPGVLGCRQLHAVVGRTNRQLRQHFASFGCTGQVAELLQQQQQQTEGQLARPQQTAGDGRPGSQLLLFGALQVHCLYAALQALPWCGPEQPDVPLLSAPVQFMHATLSPLRLEVLPDAVHDLQQHQQDGAAAVQHLHWAELSTSSNVAIMPWAAHRLVELMRDTQGSAGVEMYFETEPSSSTLNLLPGIWQQARKSANLGAVAFADFEDDNVQQQLQAWQAQGQAFHIQEQHSWPTSRSLLQGRVLRQLKVCHDGELVARLG